MADRPYNPLDRINLARSIEATLVQREPVRLPLEEAFNGAGLYAIYYGGSFPAYQPISSERCLIPIYAGKADPPGARKGLTDAAAAVGPVLCNRITHHASSIEAARNLDVEDFFVRYLVVEDIFIGLGEQLLIQQFRPLWNVHVSGFGMNAPGSRRHGGNRSEWDELHPGRPWHQHMGAVTTAAEIRRRIKAAFETGQAATLETMAAVSSPPVAEIGPELPEAPEVSADGDLS